MTDNAVVAEPTASPTQDAPATTFLTWEQVTTDAGLQARATLDPEKVEQYREAMERGAKFPPLHAVYDGEHYWMDDGYTRKAAAIKLGLKGFEFVIAQGDKDTAIWSGLGANSKHGQQLSNADKVRAVNTILDNPKWRAYSDGMIADHIGATQPFVSKHRKLWEEKHPTQNGYESSVRTGKDGKAKETKNIGKPKSKPASTSAPPAPAQPAAKPHPLGWAVEDRAAFEGGTGVIKKLANSFAMVKRDGSAGDALEMMSLANLTPAKAKPKTEAPAEPPAAPTPSEPEAPAAPAPTAEAEIEKLLAEDGVEVAQPAKPEASAVPAPVEPPAPEPVVPPPSAQPGVFRDMAELPWVAKKGKVSDANHQPVATFSEGLDDVAAEVVKRINATPAATLWKPPASTTIIITPGEGSADGVLVMKRGDAPPVLLRYTPGDATVLGELIIQADAQMRNREAPAGQPAPA